MPCLPSFKWTDYIGFDSSFDVIPSRRQEIEKYFDGLAETEAGQEFIKAAAKDDSDGKIIFKNIEPPRVDTAALFNDVQPAFANTDLIDGRLEKTITMSFSRLSLFEFQDKSGKWNPATSNDVVTHELWHLIKTTRSSFDDPAIDRLASDQEEAEIIQLTNSSMSTLYDLPERVGKARINPDKLAAAQQIENNKDFFCKNIAYLFCPTDLPPVEGPAVPQAPVLPNKIQCTVPDLKR